MVESRLFQLLGKRHSRFHRELEYLWSDVLEGEKKELDHMTLRHCG